jgi:IS605 OrfB family transposase
VNSEYVFVCVTVPQKEKMEYKRCIGVDLNVKHNLATIGSQEDNFFQFLGRNQIYRRTTYKEIRRRWQKQGKLAKVREMGDKEKRIMRDVNFKIANEIVRMAKKFKRNIALENLSGIRGARTRRTFKWFLHSWAFYDLQMKIKSKAEREGIQVLMIDPAYTSQDCSGCGNRKKCQGKAYKCSNCNLEIHRDVNASYNIALRGNQALLDLD